MVKHSKPVDAAEADMRFVLLNEPEKGRVDIRLVCDERIKPIETGLGLLGSSQLDYGISNL